MANEAEDAIPATTHLDVAARFMRLAEESHAAEGDALSWGIVLAFYSAVHWLRAFIRFKNPDARLISHDDVRSCFQEMPECVRIKVPYDTLKQLSQGVRYYGRLSYEKKDVAAALSRARQVRDWAVPKIKATS